MTPWPKLLIGYGQEGNPSKRFYPSVKFRRRGIVIRPSARPSVHGYQSRASKNYLIFTKFSTHVYNGCEKTPIENQLDTFNISIDFVQLNILD